MPNKPLHRRNTSQSRVVARQQDASAFSGILLVWALAVAVVFSIYAVQPTYRSGCSAGSLIAASCGAGPVR